MDEQTSTELRKWDRYYEGLSLDAVLSEPHEAGKVYTEVAQAVSAVVCPGASLMEAGCGSGRHSLELVRSGFRDISLMDISPRAIDCARSLFDHFGLSARFAVGDVLAGAPAGRQFDLVFNSGVVEHYSFDAQVAFLRGMASFSRKYVLVLVPNRYCHWYWIYRLQTAATGQWPFGFEKPATSYAGLIEAAGLHCLGRAYFAADAALWAISAVAGMTGQLQEMVRQLHVRGVIPLEQRCYLVGYLAAVEPQSEVPLPFYREGSGPDTGDQADHRAAQAADELAGGVAQTKA